TGLVVLIGVIRNTNVVIAENFCHHDNFDVLGLLDKHREIMRSSESSIPLKATYDMRDEDSRLPNFIWDLREDADELQFETRVATRTITTNTDRWFMSIVVSLKVCEICHEALDAFVYAHYEIDCFETYGNLNLN
ncbi:MAG: hypothetical protein FWC67_00160, partial [Defluviitaleaceae bacterium]|nr:hypothetical protein [Defluviitaleaceae bacterium]